MSLQVDIRKRLDTFDLDVQIEAGSETLGFLGPSGCGKSLTLRCIAGVDTPDEGRIIVGDRVFFDSEKDINLSAQERKTALLFQNYVLFPNFTVAENIAAGIDRSVSREERRRIVEEKLALFQLTGFGKRYPHRLSGGQQQRVALARMLAAEPQILMLDEPFSALDSYLKSSFEQEMLDLFDHFGGTVLYVSHDIDEAFRFCDRIIVVDHGRIVDQGPTRKIVSHPEAVATVKLSGCKNISRATRIDDTHFSADDWGISFVSSEPVPQDLHFAGIRAFFIRPATPDDRVNVVHMRVDRVSDSRFERTVMLVSADAPENGRPHFEETVTHEVLNLANQARAQKQAEIAKDKLAERGIEQIQHLQRIQWKVDKLVVPEAELPERGDELDLYFDPDHFYLVSR